MVQYRYSPVGAENELSESEMNRLGLNTAFGDICIVSGGDLSPSSLKAVADLLTSRPEVLMDGPSPLVVESIAGSLLSDRAFWTLFCDTVDDSFKQVSGFVRAVIEESEQPRGTIPFDRQLGLVSEDAMYAYFDTRIGAIGSLGESTSSTHFEYGELFLDWLRASDLTVELRQTRYFTQLVDLIRYEKDPTLLFERLMHFRLRNGQVGSTRSDLLELMTWRGFLRKLIDEEVAMAKGTVGPLGSQFNEFSYRLPSTEDEVPAFLKDVGHFLMEMVDLTYGNSAARHDVIEYVVRQHGLNIKEAQERLLPSHRLEEFERLRRWADEQPLRPRYETGFHVVEGARWVLDPELADSL